VVARDFQGLLAVGGTPRRAWVAHLWVQFERMDEVLQDFCLLVLQDLVAEVEFYDVSKDGVEVRVKAEQNYLDRETSEGSEDVQIPL